MARRSIDLQVKIKGNNAENNLSLYNVMHGQQQHANNEKQIMSWPVPSPWLNKLYLPSSLSGAPIYNQSVDNKQWGRLWCTRLSPPGICCLLSCHICVARGIAVTRGVPGQQTNLCSNLRPRGHRCPLPHPPWRDISLCLAFATAIASPHALSLAADTKGCVIWVVRLAPLADVLGIQCVSLDNLFM